MDTRKTKGAQTADELEWKEQFGVGVIRLTSIAASASGSTLSGSECAPLTDLELFALSCREIKTNHSGI